MDGPVDHHDHPGFAYHGLTSPPSVDKYLLPGAGSHNHDSTCHDAAAFGGEFLAPYSFDTVEPSTLQVSHTSHDDSCVDQCPGSYNSQGLPRGTFPPAPHPRPRFTTSSCTYPYLTEGPVFLPNTQHYDQTHAYFPLDSDFRYPVSHAARFVQQPPSNGQQFIAPLETPGTCTMPQCSATNDCVSRDCGSVSCSDACCTDPSCEDLVCHDETCAELGDACDSTQCRTSPPSAAAFDYGWTDFSNDWAFHQHSGHELLSHDQNCNHTNAEHDVAKVLRDLKDPVAPAQQQPAFLNFNGNVFGQGDFDVASTVETPPLTADTTVASPLSHRPSLSLSGPKDTCGQHVCRWLVKGKGDIHVHICGQSFECNEDLHTHLGKDHVGQMSSKTKYLCLWEGCSRKDDQVFASRNKLRRHISTHTSCESSICKPCHASILMCL